MPTATPLLTGSTPRDPDALRPPATKACHPTQSVYGDSGNAGNGASDGLTADMVASRAREFGVAPLGARLGRARRLFAASAAVEEMLETFGHLGWLVERNVLLGGVMVPFLLAGTRGVALVFPTDAWSIEELAILHQARGELMELLPDVPCRVVILLPFEGREGRYWFDGRGRGAVAMLPSDFPAWLGRLPDAVMSPDQVCWLRRAAGLQPEHRVIGLRRPAG